MAPNSAIRPGDFFYLESASKEINKRLAKINPLNGKLIIRR